MHNAEIMQTAAEMGGRAWTTHSEEVSVWIEKVDRKLGRKNESGVRGSER